MAGNVQNYEQHNTFVPTKFYKLSTKKFVKTTNSTAAQASALKSSIQKPYKTIQNNADFHALQPGTTIKIIISKYYRTGSEST